MICAWMVDDRFKEDPPAVPDLLFSMEKETEGANTAQLSGIVSLYQTGAI